MQLIRWKQTQIRDLWPHSLTELFETSSPSGTSAVWGGRADARGSEDKADDNSEGDAVEPLLGAKVAKAHGQQVSRGLTRKQRGEAEDQAGNEKCQPSKGNVNTRDGD